MEVAAKLGPALQVGESFVWKNPTGNHEVPKIPSTSSASSATSRPDVNSPSYPLEPSAPAPDSLPPGAPGLQRKAFTSDKPEASSDPSLKPLPSKLLPSSTDLPPLKGKLSSLDNAPLPPTHNPDDDQPEKLRSKKDKMKAEAEFAL